MLISCRSDKAGITPQSPTQVGHCTPSAHGDQVMFSPLRGQHKARMREKEQIRNPPPPKAQHLLQYPKEASLSSASWLSKQRSHLESLRVE